MLNHIVLMGRLTRDPELRHTQSGVAVASFALAVDRDFADKTTGQRETDFIDIVAWRNTAEFAGKYLAISLLYIPNHVILAASREEYGKRTCISHVSSSTYNATP